MLIVGMFICISMCISACSGACLAVGPLVLIMYVAVDNFVWLPWQIVHFCPFKTIHNYKTHVCKVVISVYFD